MKRLPPLLVLSLLPALAALGHDAYIYMQAQGAAGAFRFVSLGWSMAAYAPEAHQAALAWLRAQAPPWGLGAYATLLGQPAVLIGLAVGGVLWAVALLAWAVGAATSAANLHRRRVAAARKPVTSAQILGREQEEIEYKRR